METIPTKPMDRANWVCPFKKKDIGSLVMFGEVEGRVHGCDSCNPAPMSQKIEGIPMNVCNAESGERQIECYLEVEKIEKGI